MKFERQSIAALWSMLASLAARFTVFQNRKKPYLVIRKENSRLIIKNEWDWILHYWSIRVINSRVNNKLISYFANSIRDNESIVGTDRFLYELSGIHTDITITYLRPGEEYDFTAEFLKDIFEPQIKEKKIDLHEIWKRLSDEFLRISENEKLYEDYLREYWSHWWEEPDRYIHHSDDIDSIIRYVIDNISLSWYIRKKWFYLREKFQI